MITEHPHSSPHVNPARVFGKLALVILATGMLDAAHEAMDQAKTAIRRGRTLADLSAHLQATAAQLGVSDPPPPAVAADAPADGADDDGSFRSAVEAHLRATMGSDAAPPASHVRSVNDAAGGWPPGVQRRRAVLDAIAAAARKGHWSALARLLTPRERAELANALG